MFGECGQKQLRFLDHVKAGPEMVIIYSWKYCTRIFCSVSILQSLILHSIEDTKK